jgi:hypothetical protein
MVQKLTNEADVILAIDSIGNGEFKNPRAAAKALGVSKSTLYRRMAGTPSRDDSHTNQKKLSKWEEEALLERILDLDARGFPLKLADVAEMANILIDEDPRVERDHVGKHWVERFVKASPAIKAKISRPYDYERAKCEDPRVIEEWFRVLECMKRDHGILDEDTYNFDETGFMMGRIQPGMVVTASDRRNNPKKRQPGNREWVTLIQAINAKGDALPAYIIFACKTTHLNWFQNRDLPRNWKLDHSENGWTTNKNTLDWLKHFDEHTKARTVGLWRLLILDSHESHVSPQFDKYCKDSKILCYYLPPHSSHITQPLDVGCFSPLKKYYGDELSRLTRFGRVHITKHDFLEAFLPAFKRAFIEKNIKSAFRATGLVPWDPQRVISQLDVHLRTPTPPIFDPATWESQTPSNYQEFDSQTDLIRRRIQRHQDSSPTQMIEALETLKKGIMKSAKETALVREENRLLREANETLSDRKKRKRTFLKRNEPLGVAEGQEIIDDQELGAQLHREMEKDATIVVGIAKKKRRCKKCKTLGHNTRTCKYEAPRAEDNQDI